jgi:Integrase zinc binding domain
MSLKHLLEQRINHSMQHKGLYKLLGLDQIEYKKGIDNKVADTLSRREGPKEQLSAIKGRILDNGENEKLYTNHDGIIRYKGRLCIGEWRQRILNEMHGSSMGGHANILGTYLRTKRLFFWPKIKEIVQDYVKACEVC